MWSAGVLRENIIRQSAKYLSDGKRRLQELRFSLNTFRRSARDVAIPRQVHGPGIEGLVANIRVDEVNTGVNAQYYFESKRVTRKEPISEVASSSIRDYEATWASSQD